MQTGRSKQCPYPAGEKAGHQLVYNRAMRVSQTAAATTSLIALALLFQQLYRWNDLSGYVVETIAAGLTAGVIYFVALFALERTPDQRTAFWLILAGAVLFRLQLFPLPPALSDDLHRYRWEARVQQAGWNPYTVRPDDPRLASLRGADWEKIPGRDIPSIYPPVAELSFRAAHALARATGPYRGELIRMKLPYLAADLALVGLLAWWVRATRGRNLQLAVYAWNPLVVVEFAASGHLDALVALAVFAACVLIIRGRPAVSTLPLAAGALVKVFPVALAPLWLRHAGWPRSRQAWWCLGGAAALGVACAWPFRPALWQLPETLAYYESRWQHNNASLYALAAWFSGSTELAVGLGAGVVGGLALWAAARRVEPVRGAVLLMGALLLLSPNAFSWYFTWLVPLLALVPLRQAAPWLLLTVTQFLSYHVLLDYQATSEWRFQPFYLWLTYGPFAVALLLGSRQDPSAAGRSPGHEK